MQLAIIGATGLVGRTLLAIITERKFRFEDLLLVASEVSEGQPIHFAGHDYKLVGIQTALEAKPTLAIFSASTELSLDWAPRFAAVGTIVVDNSAVWRLHPSYKLIVPEVNGHLLSSKDKIIANPNCSTIQLVMALAPLHYQYRLKRLVIATYQSVTGSGKIAVDQLLGERQGLSDLPHAYPHPIDLNVIPHIDTFLDNGYTQEEMKLLNETRKILDDEDIQVTATAVRVPVLGGHAMAVNAELRQEFELGSVIQLLRKAPGIVVVDDVAKCSYPMPCSAQHRDEVFVGRIRRDESQPRTLNLWIVADNLRKGAATNAVQIAEYLCSYLLVDP
ncbi:MAG: aspartate-semialdehyde dehydrogenase [Bacteroidota bacterium]